MHQIVFFAVSTSKLETQCREVRLGEFNCSHRNLTHVPKFPLYTRNIDLSGNNIQVINDCFVGLDNLDSLNVSNNKIQTFQVSNASNFTKLRILDLSRNNLKADSFPTLSKPLFLQELRIQNNLYQQYPEHFISALLSLQTLYVDVFQGFRFGNGFLSLRNLTNIQLSPRNEFQLQNESFLSLRNANITSLDVDFRGVVYEVEAGVLSPFSHLQNLRFRIALRFNIQTALRALYGLRGRTMDYLNLANNFFYNSKQVQLTEQDVYYLSTMCVRRVDLTDNKISKIPISIVESRFANCLEEIYIGQNAFIGIDYIPVFLMLSYNNIHVFDCSHPKTFYRGHQIINRNNNSLRRRETDVTFYLSDSLKVINMSGIGAYDDTKLHYFNLIASALEVVDMSYFAWYLCQNGNHGTYLTSIKYVDLTGWICDNLNASFFKSSPTLETLIFRNARLSEGLKKDPDGILLRGLVNLRNVDFGSNLLVHLHDNLFLDQSLSLRNLFLRYNDFRHIPKAVQNAKHIRLLDIRNNKLSSLSETDTRILDECKETHVKISRNPFDCSCANKHMLQWLAINRERVLDLDLK